MQRFILALARFLTPAAERHWLDAFEAELSAVDAAERRNWLLGVMSITLNAHLRQLWRTGPMLIASSGIAFTAGMLDYRTGTEQLSTALLSASAGFLAYWFPQRGWQWLGYAWAGMIVLSGMGLYSRLEGSFPVPYGPVAVIIGLGLRKSFDRFQERKQTPA
jgi:hypothetical protein